MGEEVKKYYPALTGARYIAALMVFLCHRYPIDHIENPTLIRQFIAELGGAGVTFFFVLSGFLITSRYFDGKLNKSYFINRFSRIYPIFFLLTIVSLILKNNYEIKQWLLSLSFTSGLFNSEIRYGGIKQAWSLTVEEMFYFTAPLLFVFFRKKKYIQITSIIIFTGLFLVTISNNLLNTSFMSSYYFLFSETFFGRIFEFVAGAFLAREIIKKDKSGSVWTYGSIISLIIIVLVSASLASSEYKYGIWNPYGLILNNAVLPLVFTTLLYSLITERSLVRDVLSSRIFKILGLSSYSLYLIHYDIIGTRLNSLFLCLYNSNVLSFVLFNLTAVCLYYVIEKPLNKFTKTILNNAIR